MHRISYKSASFLLGSTTMRLFRLQSRIPPNITCQLPSPGTIQRPLRVCQYATNSASKSSHKSIKSMPTKSKTLASPSTRSIPTKSSLKVVDAARPQTFFSHGELDLLHRNVPITIFVMNKTTDRRIVIMSYTVAALVMGFGVYYLELQTHSTDPKSWQIYALGPIILTFASFSAFMYWPSCRNALRITAVPVASSPTTGASAFVDIIFEGRGLIPFRTRKEVIPLRQLIRYRSFAEMQFKLDDRAAARAYRERLRPPLEEMSPFIRTFVQFGDIVAEYYWALRAAFLREFYMYIHPQKANFVWRIECRGHFPLGAEFMDRLIPQTLEPTSGWKAWLS